VAGTRKRPKRLSELLRKIKADRAARIMGKIE